jgi:hypothetical protein
MVIRQDFLSCQPIIILTLSQNYTKLSQKSILVAIATTFNSSNYFSAVLRKINRPFSLMQ